jgi:hypothetical protein
MNPENLNQESKDRLRNLIELALNVSIRIHNRKKNKKENM